MLKQSLILFAAAISIPFGAAQPVSHIAVPAELLSAAQQEPLSFAMSLADASVPNGLEITAPAQLPKSKPHFDLKKQSTVDLGQVVDAFNLRHTNHHAAIDDGVVVLRPTGRRVRYLDSQAALEPVVVTGLMRAVRKIFNPNLSDTEPLAGSTLGLTPDEAGEFTTVTLDGHGRSVIAVLNQLAKQSGRGWLVVTSDENGSPRVRAFGLIHRHGSITRVDVD